MLRCLKRHLASCSLRFDFAGQRCIAPVFPPVLTQGAAFIVLFHLIFLPVCVQPLPTFDHWYDTRPIEFPKLPNFCCNSTMRSNSLLPPRQDVQDLELTMLRLWLQTVVLYFRFATRHTISPRTLPCKCELLLLIRLLFRSLCWSYACHRGVHHYPFALYRGTFYCAIEPFAFIVVATTIFCAPEERDHLAGI